MKKLGRCGRQRRTNRQNRMCEGLSQTYLPEYVSLLQWAKSIVGNSQWKSDCWHCLEPAYFQDTGRGLRATRNISPGDTIISLPLQLLITTETVFDSDIGLKILKEGKKFSPQQLLTIFLVIERSRGDTSLWFPYINSLPDKYSIPLYFSETEISLLAPRVRSLALSANERFAKAFEKIQSFIKSSARELENMFSESIVRWAWSTLNTRSVYLQTSAHPLLILDPEESNVALAPFLDLLNHQDSSQITVGINSSSNCYDIVTLSSYRKYQQVFICYGNLDNSKLLINYGFTLPSNSNNLYSFTLDDLTICINDHSQNADRKLSIIKEANLHKNLVCTIDGVSWCLMTALTIAALTWEQLSSWKILLQGDNLSQETEKLAHKMASWLIMSALQKETRHLKFVEEQAKTTHFDLVRSLSQDAVSILERSLSSLKESQHSHIKAVS